MITQFIEWFIEDLSSHNNYSSVQKEQIKYVTRVLIYEFIKLIGVLIIFSIAGYFKECILILGVMSITKPFTGGYHEETQVACFIATNIVVFFIILLYSNTEINFISHLVLGSVSLFCIYNKVPVINEKMPLTSTKLIKRNRIIAIVNSLLLILVSITFFNIWISKIIIWTSVIQAMLLFNKYKN